MLHTESVDSSTFELLQTLMADPLLDGFFLVDGTNIALRIGHRKSIDLDLFSDKPFDTTQLKQHTARNIARHWSERDYAVSKILNIKNL